MTYLHKKRRVFLLIIAFAMFLLTINVASSVIPPSNTDLLLYYYPTNTSQTNVLDEDEQSPQNNGTADTDVVFTFQDDGLPIATWDGDSVNGIDTGINFANGDFTLSFWVNRTDDGAGRWHGMGSSENVANGISLRVLSDEDALTFRVSTVEILDGSANEVPNLQDTMYHYVVVYNDSNYYFYSNGVHMVTKASGLPGSEDATYQIGSYTATGIGAADIIGNIEQVAIWDTNLDETEVAALYAIGREKYTFIPSNFSVTATNSWNGSTINEFNVTVDGVNYGTTSGTITTTLLENDTSLYNVIVYGDNYQEENYLNVNISTDLAATLVPLRSVNITFMETNGSLILQEINVTIINSNSSNIYSTSVGYLNISLLSPDSYELRTEAYNYTDRKYFFTVTNSSTENITIYLFSNVTSSELQVFKILDTSNSEVTGAVLRVEKETTAGSNLWTNYAEELSNAEGKVNTYLEKGIPYYYRFAVLVNSTAQPIYPTLLYYTSKTNFIAGVSETVEIVIFQETSTLGDYYSDLYGVTSSLGWANNDTVWCSWLDAQNTISGAILLIKGKYLDNSTSYETISTQTSSSTSGNMSYIFTPINNTIYQIECYISYSSYDILVQSTTHSYVVSSNVDKNTGLLFTALILAVTAVLALYLGVMISAVLTFAMLVFTNLVGFTDFQTSIITGLIAIAIILLVKVSKGNE